MSTAKHVVVNRAERRRAPRRAVLVECRIPGLSSSATTRVTDLSCDGVYIDTRAQFPVGATLEVTMWLRDAAVTVSGQVVNVHAGLGFGFAINRDEASQSARDMISAFLTVY